MKQGPKITLPVDIRPNFKENVNQNAQKDREARRTEGKVSETKSLGCSKEKTINKGNIWEEEELRRSQPASVCKGQDELNDSENDSFGQKASANNSCHEASNASNNKIWEDDPSAELELKTLSAKYELQKPQRKSKAVIKESSRQRDGLGRDKEKRSVSKRREVCISKRSVEKGIKPQISPKRVEFSTKKFYLVSDIYFEIEGVEIESEIEDFHSFVKEHKPKELFIDLTEHFQENHPEMIIDEDKQENPKMQIQKPRKKLPKSTKTSPYTLEEDLKISKYVDEHPQTFIPPTSVRFWERAIEKSNLLKGTRSPASLCERYGSFLINLTENNKHEIEAWKAKHGSQGLLIFQKKDSEDSGGKRFEKYVMDGIVLKYCPAILKQSTWNQEKKPEGKSRSKTRERRELTELERQFQDSNESEGESVVRGSELKEDTRNSYSNSSWKGIAEMNEDSSKSNSVLKRFNKSSVRREKALIENLNSKEKEFESFFSDNNEDMNSKAEKRVESQKARRIEVPPIEIPKRFTLLPNLSSQTKENKKSSIFVDEDEREEIVYYSKKSSVNAKKVQKANHRKDSLNDEKENLKQRQAFQRYDQDEVLIGALPSKKIKKQDAFQLIERRTSSNQITREIQKIMPNLTQQTIHQIIEKANWLKQNSKIYNKSPKEFLDLFYYCSMNATILEKCLKGNRNLLWTEEEDEMLQEGHDRVVRILKKYKKPESVMIRQAFLEKFGGLKRSFEKGKLLLNSAPI